MGRGPGQTHLRQTPPLPPRPLAHRECGHHLSIQHTRTLTHMLLCAHTHMLTQAPPPCVRAHTQHTPSRTSLPAFYTLP